MSNEKSNNNSNFFGKQETVVQTITDSSSPSSSTDIIQFIEAVSKLVPLLQLSAPDEQRMTSTLATIRATGSDTPASRVALKPLLELVQKIAQGATASAVGAGIVAMASALLGQLG